MDERSSRRPLTNGETAILTMIQQGYGPQNTPDLVFFTNSDEAVSTDGASPLMANLTNLAAWRADGTVRSDEELRKQWLRL